jgi:hypothetical protein
MFKIIAVNKAKGLQHPFGSVCVLVVISVRFVFVSEDRTGRNSAESYPPRPG